ncbi:hypothetical protein [Xanthobacter sp. ZOL 2024]
MLKVDRTEHMPIFAKVCRARRAPGVTADAASKRKTRTQGARV